MAAGAQASRSATPLVRGQTGSRRDSERSRGSSLVGARVTLGLRHGHRHHGVGSAIRAKSALVRLGPAMSFPYVEYAVHNLYCLPDCSQVSQGRGCSSTQCQSPPWKMFRPRRRINPNDHKGPLVCIGLSSKRLKRWRPGLQHKQ